MKYLSMVTLAKDEQHPHDDPTIPERMYALIQEMRAKGVLLDTGGRDPDMPSMKVARKNGSISVTDGPFAESKELVGGFALFEVANRDEAIAWTDRFLQILGTGSCTLFEVSPTPE